MPAPCALPSLLEQAMGCAEAMAAEPVQQWPLNPFPKGIRAGSATDKCLKALETAHPRWVEHAELMRVTGHSRGAIAWAVAYLQRHKLLRSIPSARNRQYLRYQAIKAAE